MTIRACVVMSVLVAGLCGWGSCASAQTLVHLPNHLLMQLSDDGRTGVGIAVDPDQPRGFARWTAAGGIEYLAADPNIPGDWNFGRVISGDGSTLWGEYSEADRGGIFQYRDGVEAIVTPTFGRWVNVMHASRDGNTIAAEQLDFSASEVVRWTASSGITRVGPAEGRNELVGMSSSGEIFCGSHDGPGASRAWLWSESAGTTYLESAPDGAAIAAKALSGDGRIVVGAAGMNAAIWRDGAFDILDAPASATNCFAYDVADGGAVILGAADWNSYSGPIVWLADGRVLTLADFFAENGVALPDLPYETEWKMAADGKTFWAVASDFGRYDSYIVTVPAPGAALFLGLGCIRRSRRLA